MNLNISLPTDTYFRPCNVDFINYQLSSVESLEKVGPVLLSNSSWHLCPEFNVVSSIGTVEERSLTNDTFLLGKLFHLEILKEKNSHEGWVPHLNK